MVPPGHEAAPAHSVAAREGSSTSASHLRPEYRATNALECRARHAGHVQSHMNRAYAPLDMNQCHALISPGIMPRWAGRECHTIQSSVMTSVSNTLSLVTETSTHEGLRAPRKEHRRCRYAEVRFCAQETSLPGPRRP